MTRLSSSLIDFARIMEIIDRYGCAFAIVTHQFNTAQSICDA